MRRTIIALIALCASVVAHAAPEKILVRGNGSEPTSLDPSLAFGVPDANVLLDLYEALVSTDASTEVRPSGASSWTISEDGKTYKFSLRKDAKWSNGEAVTAHDYVYSWRRGVNPKTASKYAFLAAPLLNADAITKGTEKDITKLGIRAVDDHTLEIKLHAVTPYFLGLMAHPFFYPLHKASVEKHGSSFTRPGKCVSNGAFMMASWVPQEKIELKKNPHYHSAASVKMDGVRFLPLESVRDEFNRYKAGEIHMTYTRIPSEYLERIRKDATLSKELQISPYLTNYFYGFNLTMPPFNDVRIRKALTLTIRRNIIVEKITRAGEKPLFGFVPLGIGNYWNAYTPEWASWPYSKRVEEAKKLLKEAGYDEKNPLSITLGYNTDESHKKIAVAIASMWKQALGIKTNMQNSEFKVFISDRQALKTPWVFRAAWQADYNDPYNFLELFTSDSGGNDIGLKDTQYDGFVKKASVEIDLKKRSVLMGQAEKRLGEVFAVAPIFQKVVIRMLKSNVGGYVPHPQDYVHSKNLFFKIPTSTPAA